MKGLDLCERYYEAYGRPMLAAQFSELVPRIAVGLVGQGSECLGFDDAISTDHDYGPGFCLWLTAKDYAAYAPALQAAYDAMPKDFLGVEGRIATAQGGGRVGVLELHAFYRQFIGSEQPPQSLWRWLHLPEHQLAACTNGRVFSDPLGEFSAIRQALASYPEDVRIKKIAAHVAIMAQSGQYNYARCMRRGETVAAELALRAFIEAAIATVYLLNHRYTPYYKWMFRGLRELPVLAQTVAPLIQALAESSCQRDAWAAQDAPDFNPYVNLADRKVALIEDICAHTLRALQAQGLTDLDVDFLEPHAWEIMKRIKDPELRRCHVMEGA